MARQQIHTRCRSTSKHAPRHWGSPPVLRVSSYRLIIRAPRPPPNRIRASRWFRKRKAVCSIPCCCSSGGEALRTRMLWKRKEPIVKLKRKRSRGKGMFWRLASRFRLLTLIQESKASLCMTSAHRGRSDIHSTKTTCLHRRLCSRASAMHSPRRQQLFHHGMRLWSIVETGVQRRANVEVRTLQSL